MLISNVEIDGALCDVRLEAGRIADITPRTGSAGDIDGQGGALIAGLHDHHIHLNASAAALMSVMCGPPALTHEAQLIAALNAPGSGWIRGIGYHHSVAGEIDREWLDRHGPKRPVRIQHRSGRLWILNGLAMKELEISEPVNGRLLDRDHTIRAKSGFPDLKPLIQKLLSYGITGVTEVTPSNGAAELRHYLENAVPLRLCIMGKAELETGHRPEIGPVKLHYHDHNLPALEALTQEVARAHKAGRAVAAHCVTRAELMLTLAAIEGAGPRAGDRIEHAAIADAAAIEWMSRLGVIVVTQPGFIAERAAAYLKDVPETEHPNLWRLKAFHTAGLPLAAGSDSPFGDSNPWRAMQAAVVRPAQFGSEAVSAELALELYTKPAGDAGAPPRRIAIGARADLCLLDRHWAKARQNLAQVAVMKTLIDGQVVYSRDNLVD